MCQVSIDRGVAFVSMICDVVHLILLLFMQCTCSVGDELQIRTLELKYFD